MKLRDYQEKAVSEIYQSWANGAQNVLLQLDTGGGKTVIFSYIVANHPGYSIVIAHRNELVSQISLTLARYGVHHKIIAQKQHIKAITRLHFEEINKSFINPGATCYVASVDTLLRLNIGLNQWVNKISLIIQDEAHHTLKTNKWGAASALFPNARGLYVTATPIRADGRGLGRQADGVIDQLILGPGMRELINRGYLTDYRIYAPKTAIDLAHVPLAANGDYNAPRLRTAVHQSTITGDVVKHYLRIAPGKLGVTFAVDIESATDIATEFRNAGVPAEVISSKTPDLLRHNIMRQFRAREILQIVNVDILGEGVDVPAIEVVSFARPTQSYALYAQQFGRGLRVLDGKDKAIIIDHVNNCCIHGLPDRPRAWSLNRRDAKKSNAIVITTLKTCLNPECALVYEKIYKKCPYCNYYNPVQNRSAPEFVDGDLTELPPNILAKLRGEIQRVDGPPKIPQYLPAHAQRAIEKYHYERQETQRILREKIAQWAGVLHAEGKSDSLIYREFFIQFGIDVANAQALGVKDANLLIDKLSGQG